MCARSAHRPHRPHARKRSNLATETRRFEEEETGECAGLQLLCARKKGAHSALEAVVGDAK